MNKERQLIRTFNTRQNRRLWLLTGAVIVVECSVVFWWLFR